MQIFLEAIRHLIAMLLMNRSHTSTE